MIPSAVSKRAEIDAAIQHAQETLGPDVVRIRYEIGDDWSGEWAIFFRVVLTDDAARNRLREVATKVVWELARHLDFPSMGVFPYHNFRSVSEQAMLREPAWAWQPVAEVVKSQIRRRNRLRHNDSTAVWRHCGAGLQPAFSFYHGLLADDLLEDARHLTSKGIAEKRESCMRRAISTAYYAVFHLLIEDFIEHWPFPDQRARLARMFDHKKMRDAAFAPTDERNPTRTETVLVSVRTNFRQLQADRHRADYDLSWNIVATDVVDAVTLAADLFAKWREIRSEPVARHYLLSMFGASR